MLLGAHESIAGGIFTAIERARTATCDTVQLFNKANSQWRAKKLADDEVERFFQLQKETGISALVSHTSYLINIASPDDELAGKSLASLTEEMQRCHTLRIPNLVMHPGSHVGSGEEAGLKRIADNLNRMFDRLTDNSVTLLLETTAGQGTNLGHTFEQLAQIIAMVQDRERMGVCLDTCHVFAAGYEIRDSGEYKKTIKAFDEIIGLKHLRAIHINDSKREKGSRVDRHEQLGEGQIGLEGFRNFVNDARFKKIPMILETPKGEDLAEDITNLKVLRGLIASHK